MHVFTHNKSDITLYVLTEKSIICMFLCVFEREREKERERERERERGRERQRERDSHIQADRVKTRGQYRINEDLREIQWNIYFLTKHLAYLCIMRECMPRCFYFSRLDSGDFDSVFGYFKSQ